MPDQRRQAMAMLPSALDRARSTATGAAPVQQPDLQSRAFTRFFDLLGGNDPAKRHRASGIADALSGSYGQFAIGMTPVVGDVQALREAKEAYQRGDVNTAALLGGSAMLGMVPVVGDVAKKGVDELLQSIQKAYPGVRVNLGRKKSGDYVLHNIVVPENMRGVGVGSDVMQRITQMADEQGARISLEPSTDYGSSRSGLYRFYERQGFVKNRGNDRDYEISEFMYRNPRTSAAEAVPEVSDLSYRMAHRPPDAVPGTILNDLTDIYGDEIYSSNALRYFGMGDDYRRADTESLAAIRAARNKPDKEITVYRAVPKNAPDQVLGGDWVALSKDYAKKHGESVLNGNYKIISTKAKASQLSTSGDALSEWGYWPD